MGNIGKELRRALRASLNRRETLRRASADESIAGLDLQEQINTHVRSNARLRFSVLRDVIRMSLGLRYAQQRATRRTSDGGIRGQFSDKRVTLYCSSVSTRKTVTLCLDNVIAGDVVLLSVPTKCGVTVTPHIIRVPTSVTPHERGSNSYRVAVEIERKQATNEVQNSDVKKQFTNIVALTLEGVQLCSCTVLSIAGYLLGISRSGLSGWLTMNDVREETLELTNEADDDVTITFALYHLAPIEADRIAVQGLGDESSGLQELDFESGTVALEEILTEVQVPKGCSTHLTVRAETVASFPKERMYASMSGWIFVASSLGHSTRIPFDFAVGPPIMVLPSPLIGTAVALTKVLRAMRKELTAATAARQHRANHTVPAKAAKRPSTGKEQGDILAK